MNISKTILFSGLLSIVIVGGAILIAKHSYPSPSQTPRPVTSEDAEQAEVKRVAEDYKTWPEYRNDKLGIAFKYPEKIKGAEMVFIQAGNFLFVRTTSSTLYLHRDELPLKDDAAILKKVKLLEKDEPFIGDWAILVQDAHSDNDLNNIIKKWFPFGKGCKLGEKTPSGQGNVYDINIAATKPADENGSMFESSCAVNWVAKIKYFQEFGRAAIWDIGQDASFPVGNCYSFQCDADLYMATSFNFIARRGS